MSTQTDHVNTHGEPIYCGDFSAAGFGTIFKLSPNGVVYY